MGVTVALVMDVAGGAVSWDLQVGVEVSIPDVTWRMEARRLLGGFYWRRAEMTLPLLKPHRVMGLTKGSLHLWNST